MDHNFQSAFHSKLFLHHRPPKGHFFTKSIKFWLSRLIVAMLGVIGVLQTALIVNAITKYLSLTHEENKIMHFVDRHSK